MNAGSGFKPLKVPSTATLFKLRTAMAIKYNNTKQNIRNIAERIVDENVPLLEVNGESNGIFAKLMKIFKKN